MRIIHSDVQEERYLSRYNSTKRSNLMKKYYECKNKVFFNWYSECLSCPIFRRSKYVINTKHSRKLVSLGKHVPNETPLGGVPNFPIEINSGKFLIIYVANFCS